MAIAPSGNQAVVAASTGVSALDELLLDTQASAVIGPVPSPSIPPRTGIGGGSNTMAFSPDGRRIVSSGSDNALRIWDAGTGTPIGAPLTGHTDQVESAAFRPDGRRIVSGG